MNCLFCKSIIECGVCFHHISNFNHTLYLDFKNNEEAKLIHLDLSNFGAKTITIHYYFAKNKIKIYNSFAANPFYYLFRPTIVIKNNILNYPPEFFAKLFNVIPRDITANKKKIEKLLNQYIKLQAFSND